MTELPLTETSEPPARPLSLVFRPSGALTPGMSRVSCMKLRPFSGSSRACSPVTRPETSPPTVLHRDRRHLDVHDLASVAGLRAATSTARASATFSAILLRAAGLEAGVLDLDRGRCRRAAPAKV